MSLDMINCSSRTFYAGLYIKKRSQDLHTRTSQEHPRGTFLQAPTQRILKILMQGPLEEDFNRISTRSSHKDFLHKLSKMCMPGPRRESHEIVKKEPAAAGADLTRSWSKSSYKSFHTSTSKT